MMMNEGTRSGTEHGSVDLSYDGSIIALSHGLHDSGKGRARIFEWDNSESKYTPMGNDILGPVSNSILAVVGMA
jgi:hypothetical protein